MAETKEIANFLQLAHDAVSEKDYDVATDHLISILQIDSRNSEAIGLMGDVAFYRKDLDTAEGYYLRRVELSPESYEAHKDLGRLYMERCEYENATKEFETALKYDNDHSDPYLYLASMYYNQGKYDEAYDWLYRLVFEVKTEQSQSDRDLYNQAYYGVSYTISQNKSVSELDGLIEQLEAKYNVSITTHLVVNPDAPLMPFRKTDERVLRGTYLIDTVGQ